MFTQSMPPKSPNILTNKFWDDLSCELRYNCLLRFFISLRMKNKAIISATGILSIINILYHTIQKQLIFKVNDNMLQALKTNIYMYQKNTQFIRNQFTSQIDIYNIITIHYLERLTNKQTMSTDLIDLLKNTLNPSLLQNTQRAISIARCNQGFATDLMIISDNSNLDISIRQSSLVVLKNLFYDQCTQGNIMNLQDYQIIKQNILEALIRNWNYKQLTPTLRQIIHLIAEKDFPERWPQIIDNAINYINNPTDFNTVASSVQALKAIMSVCSSSIDQQITLSNLCNRIVFPLFELANKLFQNFSSETLPILVSIFKIFNLAIFYHLPPIFVNNIHSLMVFIKKILDIQQMKDIVLLKRTCLKILSRLYIRHTSAKTVSYKLLSFAQNFHCKYSSPMVQTLILQLADQNNEQQILNLSLNCLANIYRNDYDENSINLINKYTKKILEICMARYQIIGIGNKIGQSIGSYITCIKQQRNSLMDFVSVIICHDTSILGQFINGLTQGDQNIQQLCLYIFSALADDIEDIPDLHQNMCQFILNYIMPILANNSNTRSSLMLKARGCQIISNFIFIDLPEQNLKSIFQFIYDCLTQITEMYLNIFALEAFTKLIIKYQQFTQFIIPCLESILKKYTQLMKQSHGQVQDIIKNFENFLGEIDGKDLGPYAIDLVKFLMNLYEQYQSNNKFSRQQQPNDDSSQNDEQDNVLENSSQGCLACIRKIFSSENLPPNIVQELGQQCIFQLIIDIFSDRELVHFQEALNLLNLYLYKSFKNSVQLSQKYVGLFPIFIYSLLGIPQGLLQMNIPNKYKSMVSNICLQPDEDIVTNVIGVLRNYASILGAQLRSIPNEYNSTYIQLLFRVVRHVHTAYNDQKNSFLYKKSDRLIILTLYTTLIEHGIADQVQINQILKDFVEWSQILAPPDRIPYLQNIFIALNFYGDYIFRQIINCSWLINQTAATAHMFTHDYQLQRLILGITKLIQIGAFNNNNNELIRMLPDIVSRYFDIKNKNNTLEFNNKNLIDQEQQAIEDMIADNTHIGLMPHERNREDLEKKNQMYEKICEQIEWDEQYNKYYYSPLEDINQLRILSQTLQNSQYYNMISPQDQNHLNKIFSSCERF